MQHPWLMILSFCKSCSKRFKMISGVKVKKKFIILTFKEFHHSTYRIF